MRNVGKMEEKTLEFIRMDVKSLKLSETQSVLVFELLREKLPVNTSFMLWSE